MHGNSFVTFGEGLVAVVDGTGEIIQSFDDKYISLSGFGSGKNQKLIASRTINETDEVVYFLIEVKSGSIERVGGVDDESGVLLSNDSKIAGYRKKGTLFLIKDGFIDKKYLVTPAEGESNKELESMTIVSVLSEKTLLALDQEYGQYYLMGEHIKKFQDIKKTTYETGSNCGDCTLEYYPDEWYFISNIFGQNSAEKKLLVYDALRRQGVNPDKVHVKFSFFINPARQ